MAEQALTNRQIEDLAIAHLLRLEREAGRVAQDTRGRGALADIEGDRIIEVKAYGRSARGADLWLETRQVDAAIANPETFHLVLVENIRQGDPAQFRVIDIHGERLTQLLARPTSVAHVLPSPLLTKNWLTRLAIRLLWTPPPRA